MTLFSRRGRLVTLAIVSLGLVLTAVVLPAPVLAGSDLPANLGNGLSRLVDLPAAANRSSRSRVRMDQGAGAIRDARGRVLVDVRLSRGADRDAVERRLERLGMRVTARAPAYRFGMLEGFVALGDVTAIATAAGIDTVHQALKPQTRVGSVTSQGVRDHRVDRIARAADGAGTTIGALSDSYDAAAFTVSGEPLEIRASDDVGSGDLPGPGNPVNQQPVAVLEDGAPEDPFLIDEGRGMLQIVHDVAPKAKLCFATAFTGPVGFADNIRRLADPGDDCGADVVVDDVAYLDEPYFEDGLIAQAVDEVAAAGTHYFSSAGNSGSQEAHGQDFAAAPAGSEQAAGLDFAGIDPRLYAAGLHDFRSGPGVDVAQTLSVGGGGAVFMQWDDPFDPEGLELGETLLSTSGEITDEAPVASFELTGEAGQTVVITADAIPSGTTDLIVTLVGPDGEIISSRDTGSSPEVIAITLPVTGTYSVEVSGWAGATGDFTLEVAEIVGGTAVQTDYNLFFFDGAGALIGSAIDVNPLSGTPIEVGYLASSDPGAVEQVQMVIARASAPPPDAGPALRLRYETYGMRIDEYVQPLAPVVHGHAAARGATAVGAYGPFRPELPEYFTSAGGELLFPFGANFERLAEPARRRKPEISASDGSNTTFFGDDDAFDPDPYPNFFGTSAAAPHAAAIAALVLGEEGGNDALSPATLRLRLEQSTYPHDLDPYFARAQGAGLSIQAVAAAGSEAYGRPGSQRDPTAFTVTYSGLGSVERITLDASRGNPTGFPSARRDPRGSLVWDPRPFDPENPLAGGFPFKIGATGGGLVPSDVTASYAVPGLPPAAPGQFERLVIDIAPGKLASGASFSFGVDRDENPGGDGTASEGNSADQLADGYVIPQGRIRRGSVRFNARLSSGREIEGEFANEIGSGWSPLDGYGFVNAESAVFNP